MRVGATTGSVQPYPRWLSAVRRSGWEGDRVEQAAQEHPSKQEAESTAGVSTSATAAESRISSTTSRRHLFIAPP